MTKQQIKEGCKKAVQEQNDLQVCNAVEWLLEYGLIDWKTRTAIYDEVARARNTKTDAA